MARTVEKLARSHERRATAMRNAALDAAEAFWSKLDENNLDQSFLRVLPQISAVLEGTQERVAALSEQYTLDAMQLQGVDVKNSASIDPKGFTGAADGRNIQSALANALIETKFRIAQGETPAQAIQGSRETIRRIVSTEIMDASRVSTQVSIVTLEPAPGTKLPSIDTEIPDEYLTSDEAMKQFEFKPREPSRKAAKLDKFGNPMGGRFGWIRQLQVPSCGRCAILAGRWYGWSAGFKRHPNCDCLHIPCLVAGSNDLITDPEAYFNSLSRADQNRLFGKANTEAILDGADIFQVVNATGRTDRNGNSQVYVAGGKKYTREGTTRRGIYGKMSGAGRGKKLPRLTPEQIFKDADGDRGVALRLLREYGYIVP